MNKSYLQLTDLVPLKGLVEYNNRNTEAFQDLKNHRKEMYTAAVLGVYNLGFVLTTAGGIAMGLELILK